MNAPEIFLVALGVSGVVGPSVWWTMTLLERLIPKPSPPPAPLLALEEAPKALPWTRKDADNAAAMYAKVPSAFWLAPEYTRYDGPEEPIPDFSPDWVYEQRRPRAAFTSPIREPHRLPHKWMGREVRTFVRDEAAMGWRLRLEKKPGDVSDPWVFITDSGLEDWRLRN